MAKSKKHSKKISYMFEISRFWLKLYIVYPLWYAPIIYVDLNFNFLKNFAGFEILAYVQYFFWASKFDNFSLLKDTLVKILTDSSWKCTKDYKFVIKQFSDLFVCIIYICINSETVQHLRYNLNLCVDTMF